MIIPFDDLVSSIPEDLRTPEVLDRLRIKYSDEVETLNYYSYKAKRPEVSLHSFSKQGDQLIAEFYVNDLDVPQSNSFNFHGQNTSQWLYAGCILIENNQVSTHH